ncbi:SatD family protein [Leekyejoonella antrihumi]|uniref:RNA polymerase subunit sigma-70 n=1 Tax=Leekyejoonella antrihumi TaxID=1660198 RepID=A0A563E508_9MICO|nr:SatD family protein [Leekyejoonella antrihumi]TWP37620.1 RNA polymerase subunit sigma-70 [Leekyejoonella antrihumi]
MSHPKTSPCCATLIGDLVGSRTAPDRHALHREVTAALQGASDLVPPATPLAITAGDEFQGTYDALGDALHTALWLRVHLLPSRIDMRFGLGWGPVTMLDSARNTQDGPAWWSARDAIESAQANEERPGLRAVRTVYRRAVAGGPAPEPINAALVCRDHLLGLLDERSLRILAGLMDGTTRAELAQREGISASAVSQRAVRDGLEVILTACEALRSVR